MAQTRSNKKKIQTEHVAIFDVNIIEDYINLTPEMPQPRSDSHLYSSDNKAQRRPSAGSTSNIFSAMHRYSAASLPELPIASRPISLLKKIDNSSPSVNSYHPIYKAHPIKPELAHEVWFVKVNTPGSIVSSLEAMAASFYKLIARNNVQPTVALYNEKGEHVGVASKAFENFKSLAEDPLVYADLETYDEDNITEEALITHHGRAKAQRLIANNKRIASLARALVISHFFMEEDAHANNLDKEGRRLDFDMSLWPIFYEFKELGLFDWSLRGTPKNDDYQITMNDIRNFPYLTDARPSYWPTSEPPVFSASMRDLGKLIFKIENNAYKKEDNEIFKLLKGNPIFIKYKFQTYYKIALTNSLMYHKLAKIHLGDSMKSKDGSNLLDVIKVRMQSRIQALRDCLTSMPEFKQYLNKYGDNALKEIIEEFKEYNQECKVESEYNFAYAELAIVESDIRESHQKIRDSIDMKLSHLSDSLFESTNEPSQVSVLSDSLFTSTNRQQTTTAYSLPSSQYSTRKPSYTI